VTKKHYLHCITRDQNAPQEVAKRANEYYCVMLTEIRRITESVTTLADDRCSCCRRRHGQHYPRRVSGMDMLQWICRSSLCAFLQVVASHRILCARTM